MTLPTAATKVHLDAATDDPKQARAELASLVDKFNDTLTHLNLSAITSTPYAVGNGLAVSGASIVVQPNTSNGSLIDVTSSGVRVGHANANSLQWALRGHNQDSSGGAGIGVLLTVTTANREIGMWTSNFTDPEILVGSACGGLKIRAPLHAWLNQAGSTEYMRITTGGNVGIGTSSTNHRLAVIGASGTNNVAFFTNNDPSFSTDIAINHGSASGNLFLSRRPAGEFWIYSDASHAMRFYTNATERLAIAAGGNVGIGTSSPGQKLTVAGTIETTSGGVKFPDGTTQTTAATSSTITLGTVIATTSGSSHTFTGIPSGVDRLVIMLDEISCNGSGTVYVQLGTSGGIVTTGYVAQYHDDAPATVYNTTGFQLNDASIASDKVTGQIVFHRVTGNTWVGAGIVSGESAGATTYFASITGRIALSGALDRIRIVNASSNAFDNGQVNIQYQD